MHVSIRAELSEIGRNSCPAQPNGIRKSQVNKAECSKWVIDESYRPNGVYSECTNRILIGQQMAEKIAKYARSRGSFVTNCRAITKWQLVLLLSTNNRRGRLDELSLECLNYMVNGSTSGQIVFLSLVAGEQSDCWLRKCRRQVTLVDH